MPCVVNLANHPRCQHTGPLQSLDEGRRSGWRCAMPATSTVPEEFALLLASFATITDPRLARGKVHPLPGVLALVVLGLMAGCRSLSAISRFGQIHPEVATLHRLLRRVSVGEVR